MRRLAAVAAAALALAACISGEGRETYVCDKSADWDRTCVELGPLDDGELEFQRTSCETSGGTFGTAACPTQGLYATCAWPPSMSGRVEHWYAGTPQDVDSYWQSCVDSGGRWTWH